MRAIKFKYRPCLLLAMCLTLPISAAHAQATGVNTDPNASPQVPLYLGAAGSVYITIDPTGLVGIGTTTPIFSLQVENQFGVSTTAGANYFPILSGGVDGGASAALGLAGGTSNNGNLAILARGASGGLLLYAGGVNGSVATTERMRIMGNGYVGIGTCRCLVQIPLPEVFPRPLILREQHDLNAEREQLFKDGRIEISPVILVARKDGIIEYNDLLEI